MVHSGSVWTRDERTPHQAAKDKGDTDEDTAQKFHAGRGGAARRLDGLDRRRRTGGGGARGKRDLLGELNIRPFINAAGTYTTHSGSLMRPEVMEAINYASQYFVEVDQLHDAVGKKIAAMVGSEAAMVTAGAASALTLATAGVLTGTDKAKINQIPDLTGMKSEVIVQKAHRFPYDHGIRNTGVKMVEVTTRAELEQCRQRKDRHAVLFELCQRQGRDQGRGVRRDRQEDQHSHLQRRRRRRASGGEYLQVGQDGFRPGLLLGRQGR